MHSSKRPSEVPAARNDDDLDDVMSPELSDEELARARPIREAPASLVAALPKKKGGRPRLENPKAHVSLRIDRDVLAAYKATGVGWQIRMREALERDAGRVKAAGAKKKI